MVRGGGRERRRESRRIARELLYHSNELRVVTRKGELLSRPRADSRQETVTERRDFVNVGPVLAARFVKDPFELSNIDRGRICALFKGI